MSSRSRILRGSAVDAWRPAPAGEGLRAPAGAERKGAPTAGHGPASGQGAAGVPRGGPGAAGRGAGPGPGAAGEAEARRLAGALADRVAALEAERADLRRRVAELEEELAAARAAGRAAEEAWRGAAVDLAVAVARRLLRRELALHPEEVASLAAEVLGAAAPAARSFRLAASPADAERLEKERGRLTARLPAGADLEIVADEGLAEGDLVLETPAGTWDARVETGLSQLAEAARAAVGGGAAADGAAAAATDGCGAAAVSGTAGGERP